MRSILIICALLLCGGCAASNANRGLDPAEYPASVRQGDIIDRYVWDATRMPHSPRVRALFGTDYVELGAAERVVRRQVGGAR